MFKKKKTVAPAGKGQGRQIFENFMQNKSAVAAVIILGIIVFLAVTADLFLDYENDALALNVLERLQPPSRTHWFGTDGYGRDVFTRVVYGARYSLAFGILCTGISIFIGAVLGSVVAYYGSYIDTAVMRFLDVLMCIPGILLMLLMVTVVGQGVKGLVVALVISGVPGYTRLVRSVVLSIIQQDYIEAAKASGSSDFVIIFRHILPNAVGPIIVSAMMSISGTILSAAGLSYLGMGIQPPAPEWGSMLNEAAAFIRTNPSAAIFPGVAIALTVLCFNLIGDGLADAIDPRRRD